MRQLDVIPNYPRIEPGQIAVVASVPWLFWTIQGEGSYVGTPSLFVRLYGCNLTCEACDTKYTWHPTKGNPERHRVVMPVKHVAASIAHELLRSKFKHIVVTGGEPTLQGLELVEVLDQLPDNTVVTMETNGTRFDKALVRAIDLASLSPKLPWLKQHGLESVERWLVAGRLEEGPWCQVKLVVEEDSDLDEAIELLTGWIARDLLNPCSAFIQPEFGNYGLNVKSLVDRCIDAGVCILPQVHKAMGVP